METPLVMGMDESFIRLLVALLLGLVLGTERYLAHKTAGMRTYGLVALAAAMFIIIGQRAIPLYEGYNADPLRMASEIVTGVGFLGAGLIILKDSHIRNLTTASGLWIAAGIGMACGFGFYNEAVFVTILTLLVMSGMYYLEKHLERSHDSDIENED